MYRELTVSLICLTLKLGQSVFRCSRCLFSPVGSLPQPAEMCPYSPFTPVRPEIPLSPPPSFFPCILTPLLEHVLPSAVLSVLACCFRNGSNVEYIFQLPFAVSALLFSCLEEIHILVQFSQKAPDILLIPSYFSRVLPFD